MNPSTFDELRRVLESQGPGPALERLVETLRAEKRYSELFDALLLKKRHAMGLPLVSGNSLADLPEDTRRVLEDYYADCCREVGGLYLVAGQIPHAWVYLRAIGEPRMVAEALERLDPSQSREDRDALVDIALYQGVHPRKGLELVLASYGTCNAVTAMEQQMVQAKPPERWDCVRTLVRHLYGELASSLRSDIARREAPAPEGARIIELIAGRDWLFGDNAYHIDTSHLGAVVRYSRELDAGPELEQAVELAEYGRRLSPMFQYKSDPPFDKIYDDHLVYLKALAGREVDEAVRHFRKKLDDVEDGGKPYCAAVLVTLLSRVGRTEEAIQVSVENLAEHQDAGAGFPTVKELCQRSGDYRTLVEFARGRNDLVTYTAGLV